MACSKCGGNNLVRVSGKTSDMCFIQYGDGKSHEGYVPGGLNIGGGDYLRFSFCADCGTIQGEFPVNPTIAIEGEPDDLDEFDDE